VDGSMLPESFWELMSGFSFVSVTMSHLILAIKIIIK
jgi:hypothetical protein